MIPRKPPSDCYGVQDHPLLLSGVLDYAARWHPEQVQPSDLLRATPDCTWVEECRCPQALLHIEDGCPAGGGDKDCRGPGREVYLC